MPYPASQPVAVHQPMRPHAHSDLPLRSVTIDVEEYFHIEAARGTIQPSDWDRWPSRVEQNVDRLLNLFATHHQCGTFFILGHVAQRHPKLAAQIAQAGHEIASHGTGHDRLHRLNPESFRQDLLTSKHLLEDQSGRRVLGYRSPTFSVVRQTAWALDVLIECGFQYDASIFPVRHHWYGVPDAPTRPFHVQQTTNGPTILEVPPLTWNVRKRSSRPTNLAVAGGGYFRLLPLWFMKRGLAQAAVQGRPAILYFHPWEFDPGTPKMPLPLTGRIRTYKGLEHAERRLHQIMSLPARWAPIQEMLDQLERIAAEQSPFCLSC